MIRTILLCVALATPLAAQDVIGTSVLGGKRVELLSDQTWRFAAIPELQEGCVPINAEVGFCGSILDWRPQSTAGTDFLRIFRHDDRNFGGLIYERLGAADGLDLEALRSIALQGSADAAGVPIEELPVLEVRGDTIGDVPGETVVFGARVQGLPFVFQNTMVVTDHRSLQMVVWSIGTELTDDMEALHGAFLDAFTLDLPENTL